MLLLIEPAQRVGHAGAKDAGPGERRFHIRDARPQPAPVRRAVTSTICCRFSRVISGWPETVVKRAMLPSGTSAPEGVAMGRRRQLVAVDLCRARQAHAHTDELLRPRILRGHGARHLGLHDGGDLRGIQAQHCRAYRVHGDVDGIARGNDAVIHRVHALDPADRGGDAQRRGAELGRIGGGELDLDRLRHAGEVADLVAHQFMRIDLHARHLGGDLVGDAVHHRVHERAL